MPNIFIIIIIMQHGDIWCSNKLIVKIYPYNKTN